MSFIALSLLLENFIVFLTGFLLGRALGYFDGYRIGTEKFVKQIKKLHAVHTTRKNPPVDVEE